MRLNQRLLHIFPNVHVRSFELEDSFISSLNAGWHVNADMSMLMFSALVGRYGTNSAQHLMSQCARPQ